MACSSSAFAACPIAIDSFCFASASNPKAIEFVPKDFDFAPKAVAPSFASASTPTAIAVFPSVLLFPPIAIEPSPLAMAFPLPPSSFPPMAIV